MSEGKRAIDRIIGKKNKKVILSRRALCEGVARGDSGIRGGDGDEGMRDSDPPSFPLEPIVVVVDVDITGKTNSR